MKLNRSYSRALTQFLAAVCVLVQSMTALRAQVELDRFFPPAVQRGVATSIKADGKFPQWPVKIECDVASVSVACGEKAGEFQVTAPESFVGIAWIRVHDDQSASSLVPIMIESSNVVVETEPNESLPKSQVITCPSTAVGKLEKNGDVDVWKVALRSGEQLVASVTANTLISSPLDAVLQVVDSRGLVIAQAEDNVGLDPQLIFTATKDADYYLRLFCFPETPTGTIGFAGGANFNYAMRVTTIAFLDHTLPFRDVPADKLKPIPFGWNIVEPVQFETSAKTNISPETLSLKSSQGWQWYPSNQREGWSFGIDEQSTAEQIFDLPLLYFGHILHAKEADRIRIRVRKDVNYRAEIASREFGFKLDSVLRVLKPDLKTQVAQNDDSGRRNYDAGLEFKSIEDGELVIEVSDLADSGSLRHAYELQVKAVEPAVGLSVSADHYRIGIGKSLEIPVTIERQSGFAARLEFSAKSLPAGVAFERIVSEPKGDTAKTIKLKLTASADAAAFQGPIELIATPIDDAQAPLSQPLPVQHSLRPLISLEKIWLSVAIEK